MEPKQPPWEALSFLTARYGLTGDRNLLRMVETTLQGMWHGIYDFRDQGFFRYSVSRDWKVPHYEKMLVTNANLSMACLEAYQLTRKVVYRNAAGGIIQYLLDTLYDKDEGLFYASQDADEPFYQGSWKDRASAAPPPIDRTFYAGWNALAAQSLVHAAGALGSPAYLRIGASILDKLWQSPGLTTLAFPVASSSRETATPSWPTRFISFAPACPCTSPPAKGNASNAQTPSPQQPSGSSAHPAVAATTPSLLVPLNKACSPGSSPSWKTATGPRP